MDTVKFSSTWNEQQMELRQCPGKQCDTRTSTSNKTNQTCADSRTNAGTEDGTYVRVHRHIE